MTSAEPRSPRRPPHPAALGVDTAERIGAGCYGALVAATTLIGLNAAPLGSLILIVVLTNTIYFATHVFAHTIGDRTEPPVSGLATVRHHARVSAPMVSVTFVPIAIVVILEFRGVGRDDALLAGVIAAVLYLVGVATTGAYLRGLRPLSVVLVAAVTFVVSLALVGAKLSLH